MVEKKIVVENLTFSYSGLFSVNEVYKAVEDWIARNSLNKELKKKLQHNEKRGRKIEWLIEIWASAEELARQEVRLRMLFNHVRDVDYGGKSMNNGDVLIIIDGILETDYAGLWHKNPLHYFMRAIVDKYINKFYTHQFEGKIASDCYNLRNYLFDFFRKYRE